MFLWGNTAHYGPRRPSMDLEGPWWPPMPPQPPPTTLDGPWWPSTAPDGLQRLLMAPQRPSCYFLYFYLRIMPKIFEICISLQTSKFIHQSIDLVELSWNISVLTLFGRCGPSRAVEGPSGAIRGRMAPEEQFAGRYCKSNVFRELNRLYAFPQAHTCYLKLGWVDFLWSTGWSGKIVVFFNDIKIKQGIKQNLWKLEGI